ncbi:MAG: DUF5723 family protein [Elusimicrobiota bacterium]
MYKKIISIIALTLFVSTAMLYSAESPFYKRGVRALGMGGAHVCLSDDQNAFFYNPAGITKREKRMLTLVDMPISITDDMLKFYDWYKDNEDALKDFDKLPETDKTELLNDITDKITSYRTRFTFGGPIFPLNFNYISGPRGANNNMFWGIGVFDQVDIGFNLNSGILIPKLDIWGHADVAGMFMLARKFDNDVSVGANIKYIGRAGLDERGISILALEGLEPMIQPGFGMGVDLGVTWDFKENMEVGMSIMDVGGTPIKYKEATKDTTDDGVTTTQTKEEYTGIIYSRVNLGFAYKPIDTWNLPLKPDLTLAVDIHDVLDSEDDGKLSFSELFKKMHMGAEFQWNLVQFRCGLNSGYPTLGLGASLLGFKVEYAYYTDEMGLFPGDLPETNHMISVAWRFGAGRVSEKESMRLKEKRLARYSKI